MDASLQPQPHVETRETGKARDRTKRRRRTYRSRGRDGLRAVYFSFAALWGFVTGTGAIVVVLSEVGRPIIPGHRWAILLLTAGVVALAGGLVASVAYRDAAGRR
jgi:hypothetical protein